jgi:hypothetical protein
MTTALPGIDPPTVSVTAWYGAAVGAAVVTSTAAVVVSLPASVAFIASKVRAAAASGEADVAFAVALPLLVDGGTVVVVVVGTGGLVSIIRERSVALASAQTDVADTFERVARTGRSPALPPMTRATTVHHPAAPSDAAVMLAP